MSQRPSGFFLFVVALALSALAPSLGPPRVRAQDFGGVPGSFFTPSAPPAEPEEPAPSAPPAPVGQVAQGPRRGPRRLELALTVSALVEVGVLHSGTDNPRTSADESTIGVVGPLGGLSLFLGHDVALFDDDASGMALGYLAMGLVGIDTPIGRGQTMIVQRHELALAMRLGSMGILLGVGGVFGHFPLLGATIPGATIAAQLGFFAGPVWIGFPLGVDIWLPPHAPAVSSETFALTIGLSTL